MNQAEKEKEANRIVNEVWSSCWKDTRPFDEVSGINKIYLSSLVLLMRDIQDLLKIFAWQHYKTKVTRQIPAVLPEGRFSQSNIATNEEERERERE